MDDPQAAAHTGAVPSVYKNARGQRAVQQWCSDALARADFSLTTATVDTRFGAVHLTSAGVGRMRVLMVPGTAFSGGAALPWLKALSARWPTTVVDLPGQPGLSDAHRPGHARAAWYGRVLDEVLARLDADGVVLVGNSLGGAVALAAKSPRVVARALIAPAGFIRLGLDAKVAAASTAWLVHPTPENTRSMLRMFVAPGAEPPGTVVEWMTLVATHCRTTLAPPPLFAQLLARRAEQPCVVGVGGFDRFLPPRRLAPAVHRTMGLDIRVFPGVGHLNTDADLDEVVSLVAELADAPARDFSGDGH